MRVAVSDSPSGMFKQVKKLLPPFSIDAHAVKTPSGLYLFYCNNDYEAERAGTFIQCDKLTDPYTLERKPVAVVRPTIDEEIYQKDRFKKGQHWHTIEGAFYFYKEGTHYLMYSGACYQLSLIHIFKETASQMLSLFPVDDFTVTEVPLEESIARIFTGEVAG